MNTQELVTTFAKTHNLSKTKAKEYVEFFVGTISKEVSKGQDVRLSRLGTFSRTKRKARVGRNPQTGESIKIAAAKYPRFKPSATFKEIVK